MSKEIFLYNEDKKYKCAFELAETTDHFGCPDHSAMVLFEERENGTYIIAQAKDKILETEKDQRIAELEEQLKNVIVLPKYNKGQKIYSISGKKILEGYFQEFNDDVWAEVIVNPTETTDEDGYTDVDFDVDMFWHKNTFATKEEAEAKLKELQGETK